MQSLGVLLVVITYFQTPFGSNAAQKFRKPLVFGTFFFILFKIVPILEATNSPDPNPDPKAERCGKAQKPPNLQTTPRPETIPLRLPPSLPFSLFTAAQFLCTHSVLSLLVRATIAVGNRHSSPFCHDLTRHMSRILFSRPHKNAGKQLASCFPAFLI